MYVCIKNDFKFWFNEPWALVGLDCIGDVHTTFINALLSGVSSSSNISVVSLLSLESRLLFPFSTESESATFVTFVRFS